MEEKPLVSVIVPLYNQGEYVKEMIESVLNQSYKNWEMIIMDDGSSDEGGVLAESYKTSDSRIIYYKQLNSGPSLARNNAISKSKGKYILPLDGDDMIGERYIEKAVDYLEKNNDCKLVYCRAEMFGVYNGIWSIPDYQYDKLLWENLIFCSAVYRRSDYDKTNGYNPNMVYGLEDWDFWLTLLSPEDKVHRIDEVLFHYRIKSVSRSTKLIDNYDNATMQLYKNHPSLYEDFVVNIISLHNCIKQKDIEISEIINGKTYRVGERILSPFRFIKRILKDWRRKILGKTQTRQHC